MFPTWRRANPVNAITDEVPDRGQFKGDKILKLPVAKEGGPAVRSGHPTGPIFPNNYIFAFQTRVLELHLCFAFQIIGLLYFLFSFYRLHRTAWERIGQV